MTSPRDPGCHDGMERKGVRTILFLHVVDQTLKKIRAQIANILTFTNLFLGGLAIIEGPKSNVHLCLLLIFTAALLDRFDGMIARKLKTESEFGKQLDSMSDIISFGVAPALLIYHGVLHEFGIPGTFFTVLYIGCGAFRLVRFNLSQANGYFTGLPITVAGCIATFSFLFIPYFPPQVFIFMIIILSFLMISSIKVKKI